MVHLPSAESTKATSARAERGTVEDEPGGRGGKQEAGFAHGGHSAGVVLVEDRCVGLKLCRMEDDDDNKGRIDCPFNQSRQLETKRLILQSRRISCVVICGFLFPLLF